MTTTGLKERDVQQLNNDNRSYVSRVTDAGYRVRVAQEANNMKAACKRLFPDFDPSKFFRSKNRKLLL